jgi:hypothetical protein
MLETRADQPLFIRCVSNVTRVYMVCMVYMVYSVITGYALPRDQKSEFARLQYAVPWRMSRLVERLSRNALAQLGAVVLFPGLVTHGRGCDVL